MTRRSFTLWLIGASLLSHLACCEDFSWLRPWPIDEREAQERAERTVSEICRQVGIPRAEFEFVPYFFRRPTDKRPYYFYRWEAQKGDAGVAAWVQVSEKGKVEWAILGDIERLRAMTSPGAEENTGSSR